MSDGEFLAGRLLLAMPGMRDPNFERSVIPLFMHDENGAFGIGVGHIRDGIGFHDVLRELDIATGKAPDTVVHHGGPVEPGRGFVLHTPDWKDETTRVVEQIAAFSHSLDILRAIAAGEGPAKWLFSLGYAGWGPGQLDDEMQRHGWYAAQGSPTVLFGHAASERWDAAWRREGIDPAAISGQSGHA